MGVGYDKILLLYNSSIYETADVISTFVYRKGVVESNFSFSAAVGLFNSIVNFFFVVIVNKISDKVSETSLVRREEKNGRKKGLGAKVFDILQSLSSCAHHCLPVSFSVCGVCLVQQAAQFMKHDFTLLWWPKGFSLTAYSRVF